MGEPTIYKPSIYKGNGIYKNGANGGGGGGDIKALGTIEIGGKEYPYNQYGGILFTTLNLDFAPLGVDIGVEGVPSTPAAWYPNNNENEFGWNGKKYGLLYNKFAVPIINNELSDGWEVATYASIWNNLRTLYSNGLYDKPNKWKKEDISGWNGTNQLLFNAVPAGFRDDDGNFYNVGTRGVFWMYETPNTQLVITDSSAYNNGPNNGKPGCSLRLCKYI